MKKIKLFNNTSSLYKLNTSVNNTMIYIKRDDIIDFAFGGNKVRMFEYIGQKVVESNVKKIITYGSIHSNHVRVAAATANYLGVDCDIIFLTEPNEILSSEGNCKLMGQLNVNIVQCNTSDATQFIDEYLEKQSDSYMWIPGGGHTKEAVYGYIDAAEEIILQAKDLKVHFDAVFLPTGTGTTQAGLILGLKDYDCDVIGITVARTVERCKSAIKELLDEAAQDYEMNNRELKVNVIDNMTQKYGVVNEEIKNTMKQLARHDGIFLDPIYNAKAFTGMMKVLDNSSYKNVLYINTGGSPNFFVD